MNATDTNIWFTVVVGSRYLDVTDRDAADGQALATLTTSAPFDGDDEAATVLRDVIAASRWEFTGDDWDASSVDQDDDIVMVGRLVERA